MERIQAAGRKRRQRRRRRKRRKRRKSRKRRRRRKRRKRSRETVAARDGRQAERCGAVKCSAVQAVRRCSTAQSALLQAVSSGLAAGERRRAQGCSTQPAVSCVM